MSSEQNDDLVQEIVEPGHEPDWRDGGADG